MVTAVYKRKAAYATVVHLFEQAFIARRVPKVFREDTNHGMGCSFPVFKCKFDAFSYWFRMEGNGDDGLVIWKKCRCICLGDDGWMY